MATALVLQAAPEAIKLIRLVERSFEHDSATQRELGPNRATLVPR